MSRTRRAAGALLCTLLAAFAPAASAAVDPLPLSEAERQAVELALLYLDQGAAAWWPRLAAGSPLRALGRDAALEEIAVRAGPREGAEWRLETLGPGTGEHSAVIAVEFPSGADEVLELVFDPAGGLLSVISLAEPRELPPLVIPSASPPAAEDSSAAAGDSSQAATSARPVIQPRPRRSPPRRAPLEPAPARPVSPLSVVLGFGWMAFALLGLVVAAVVVVVLVVRGGSGGGGGETRRVPVESSARRPPPPSPVPPVPPAAILLAAAAVAMLACRGDGSGDLAEALSPSSAAPAVVRLGALRPIRDALCRGEPVPSPPAALEGAAAHAERLWHAEGLLLEMDLDGATAVLEGFPTPSEIPLAERLRARLAQVRGDRLEAPAAYDRALRLGPDHDGLRLEMAEVLYEAGYSTEGETAMVELLELGTRNAGVYYTAAAFGGPSERIEEAEALLRTAWLLEPIERAELFGSPTLAFLTIRPGMFELIGLSSADEPEVAPPFEGRRPIPLPAGAHASLTGRLLRVAVGPARLEVPGGWTLAPEITPVEDAAAARRSEVEALLASAGAGGPAGGRLIQPGHLRPLLRAALSLAREHRWSELDVLTAGIGDDVDRLPPDLVRLRAVALMRLGRESEATRLMIGLARAQALGSRRDAGSLYQLGELFAASGEYELAMRLIRKAGELSPYPLGDLRLRQIALDQELAESYRTLRSEHFELRFPVTASDEYAKQVAWVLEEELTRLQRWIPGAPVETIEVSLFPIADFVSAFSGSIDIIGLYDGRVRVPFAHLRSLHPYLVSTLSHELAHALIDQKTGGRAPDWVQEGLAQHVEMVQNQINPIPDLEAKNRVLSLAVVDAALDGFSDPELVELAYAQAAWAMHSIEARHGVAGIHRLLDAYADGAEGEEAVRRAFGTDLAGFDRVQREWCLEQAPPTWPARLRRYDEEIDSPLAQQRGGRPRPDEPRIAARWSRRTPGAMEQWHGRYQRRVQGSRRALGPAVERVRTGLYSPTSCAGLEKELAALLADPSAFGSPDAAPGRALRSAFEGFGRMAAACSAGDMQHAARELAAAERELRRAAELLRPYGLAP